MRLKAYFSIRCDVGDLAQISRPHCSAVASSSAWGTTALTAPMACISAARVGAAEGEDLPGELLAHLAGEVGRAVAAVEGADVGVGLLEAGVLGAGQGHVAGDVERVAAAGRPAVDDGDDELRHEPDEPLALEDVEPAGPGRVDGLGRFAAGVLVTGPAPDALVAAGAEGPAAVLGAGAVAGEEDAADVGRHAGVVEGPVELVDRVGPEGVPDLGAVEGDADHADVDAPGGR